MTVLEAPKDPELKCEFWWHCDILPRIHYIAVLTRNLSSRNLAGVPIHTHRSANNAYELLAAAYLQTQGLVLLARNLRCRGGALDLVCLDRDVLAIIDVQRVRIDSGGELAMSRRKQLKIMYAAQFFLQRNVEWRAYRMRFDVVSIERLTDGTHRVLWRKDLFRVT